MELLPLYLKGHVGVRVSSRDRGCVVKIQMREGNGAREVNRFTYSPRSRSQIFSICSGCRYFRELLSNSSISLVGDSIAAGYHTGSEARVSLGCPSRLLAQSSPLAPARRRASASLSACAPLSAPPKSWLKAGPESRRPWAQMPPGGSCGNQPRSRASAKGRNCAFALGESTSDQLVFFFFFFVLKHKAAGANRVAAGLEGKGRTQKGREAARREKVRRGKRGEG